MYFSDEDKAITKARELNAPKAKVKFIDAKEE